MQGRLGKTRVGVLTVIEEEFEAAQLELDAESRVPRTRYFCGDDPKDFVLARMADRGNVAAAEATTDLIEHWRPDVVLLLGIAGALATGPAALGDVVIPDYIHYGDFRKITEGSDALRFAAYDHPTVSLRTDTVEGLKQEAGWAGDIARQRPEPDGDPSVEVGALVACEKVLGDPDHPEQERVFATFDNAIAIDMESFGVARAVHHQRFDASYNPRLTIIRGISDMVHRGRSGGVPRDRMDSERAPARTGDEAEHQDLQDRADSSLGRITTLDINTEERAKWKPYAAATSARFAAAVVREHINN